jgi:hypothetical protein
MKKVSYSAVSEQFPMVASFFISSSERGTIENGDPANPCGKGCVSVAVDDTTYRKRPALLQFLGSIDIIAEIVRVGFQGNQITLQWFP